MTINTNELTLAQSIALVAITENFTKQGGTFAMVDDGAVVELGNDQRSVECNGSEGYALISAEEFSALVKMARRALNRGAVSR